MNCQYWLYNGWVFRESVIFFTLTFISAVCIFALFWFITEIHVTIFYWYTKEQIYICSVSVVLRMLSVVTGSSVCLGSFP